MLKVLCFKGKVSSSLTPDSCFLCHTEKHQLQTNRKISEQPQQADRPLWLAGEEAVR